MTDSEALAALRAALFPAPVPVGGNHFTSADAIDNLDAALIDLKRTGADAGCIATLERIAGQLEAAKRVLEIVD